MATVVWKRTQDVDMAFHKVDISDNSDITRNDTVSLSADPDFGLMLTHSRVSEHHCISASDCTKF